MAVSTISAATSGLLGTYVRPNLLDNWYFVGGGSQKGGGTFPLNQRTATTYSGKGYFIDRWRSATVDSSYNLYDDGLECTSTVGQNVYVNQHFDPGLWKLLAGRTVCASILLSDGELYSGSGVFPSNATTETGGTVFLAEIGDNGDIMVENLTDYGGMFTIHADIGKSIRIAAVKLELGDTQTLAHNEGTESNPIWVLNELPNFHEEYLKCLRYLWVIGFPYPYAQISAGGHCVGTTDSRVIFQPPVPMIYDTTPSVSIVNGTLELVSTNNEHKKITSIQWVQCYGAYIRLAVTVDSAYANFGGISRIEDTTGGARIIVSAEKYR